MSKVCQKEYNNIGKNRGYVSKYKWFYIDHVLMLRDLIKIHNELQLHQHFQLLQNFKYDQKKGEMEKKIEQRES